MTNRVAVIEVGSRAIRLLVADILPKAELRIVATDWQETGLAKALRGDPEQLDARITDLLATIRTFLDRARDQNPARIATFGTEAVRRLDSAHLDRLKAAVPGFQVLTRSQEAELSMIAGVMGTMPLRQEQGSSLVIDQGSGSMEVVIGRVEASRVVVEEYRSYKLGTEELIKLLEKGDNTLERLRDALRTRVASYESLEHTVGGRPIVLGSAATKLAWLGVRRDPMRSYDPRAVHGQVVRLSHIDALVRMGDADPISARRVVDPRNPDGSEFQTVMAGLVGLEAFLKREKKDEFVVCAHGTRHGLAWKLALASAANRTKSKTTDIPSGT